MWHRWVRQLWHSGQRPHTSNASTITLVTHGTRAIKKRLTGFDLLLEGERHAVLVETQTDNKNRTAADVRSMFVKSGGQLAGSGAVAWQFEPRGLISVPRNGVDADEIALAAIDAGADDVDTSDEDTIEIYTTPGDLRAVRQALESAGIKVESAESAMIAKQTVELDSNKARSALRLIELLEDLDDVQRVTANFDIPEDVYAEVAG